MPAKALLLLGCLAVAGEVPASPPTRLYVRTVPPGAKVILEGKSLGSRMQSSRSCPARRPCKSNWPATCRKSAEWRFGPRRSPASSCELKRRPEAAGRAGSASPPGAGEADAENKDDAASIAANAYLTDADLPAPIRGAMLTVLRQHPGESRWSGRAGTTMFGIAAKRLPAGADSATRRASHVGVDSHAGLSGIAESKIAPGSLRGHRLDRRDHLGAGGYGSGRKAQREGPGELRCYKEEPSKGITPSPTSWPKSKHCWRNCCKKRNWIRSARRTAMSCTGRPRT